MLSNFVIPVVLLVNGLAAGVLVGTELGGFPLMAALPADRYVQAHAFFSTRYDPFMPACLVLTVLGDAVLAAVTSGGPSALHALAGIAALGTVVISLTKNVPLNKWVRTVDPRNPPDDWQERRRRWGQWNRRRAVMVTLALALNCAALGLGA